MMMNIINPFTDEEARLTKCLSNLLQVTELMGDIAILPGFLNLAAAPDCALNCFTKKKPKNAYEQS